jgi:hypothetical protein
MISQHYCQGRINYIALDELSKRMEQTNLTAQAILKEDQALLP